MWLVLSGVAVETWNVRMSQLAAQMSCKTQPNCRESFNIATACLSPSFCVFFARLIFNLPVLLCFVLSAQRSLVSHVICGGVGPSTASHRDGHPCTVDVLPGPTGVI